MNRLDLLWRAMLWALVGVIVWASLTPHPVESGVQHGDKFQHLAGYGVLMFWAAQLPGARWRSALACVALGVLMEIAQGLTGHRQADALDALANVAGVACGWQAARALPNVREWVARRFAH